MGSWKRPCAIAIAAAAFFYVEGCGSGTGSTVTTAPPATTYTIGGTVSGLAGSGLVLQDNGGNNLAVSASGGFTFSTAIASGSAYVVTVLTQPSAPTQSCLVFNGTGTASANVSSVLIACATPRPPTYTIGGTVSGLVGSGLILQNNGGDNLAVSANGSFAFATPVASGDDYAVSVLTQPSGQICTVSTGSGKVNANMTTVQVSCITTTASTYTIGGTVSGLAGMGLVLQDNGGNNLAVSASGSFTFSTAIASAGAYAVTVLTQPSAPAQTCVVSNGSGTASANVSSVQVACTTITYTIGGSVTGLTGMGLVLQDNGGNNLAVSANGSFIFNSIIASGGAYAVTVLTQPSAPAQVCVVTDGSGTANAKVTNVLVTCTTTTYTIGGTVSGLSGIGLVLQDNGTNNLTVSANGVFAFNTTISSGGVYSVSVLTQPTGQNCAVSNSSGIATANVTTVQVGCVGEWAWMGGSTVASQPGVYGTLGTAAAANIPGGRLAVVRWTDASGNFWLFGGVGFDSTGSEGDLNDLWKYTPSATGGAGEWTWMGGSSAIGTSAGQSGVYGTQGTAAATNIPGGRYSSVSWTDASGNLWLFGGFGNDSTGPKGSLNDLWKYTPGKTGDTGEWTWMGGSSTAVSPSGVYGTLGTASENNIPGGRYDSVSWTDASGNLWLFGGVGFDSTRTYGYLNDLWKYTPGKTGDTGEWTWMGGSMVINQSGVYGTQGTAAAANTPGAREDAMSWTDTSGNLWLFGGVGFDSTGTEGSLNDLWKYTPGTAGGMGKWAWMGGSSTVPSLYLGQSGVYGMQGTATTTNIPGGREFSASWTDASGNLWLFAGFGDDSTGTEGYLNDLWTYTPSATGDTGEWTWMGGSSTVVDQPGVYGTQGTAAATNIPGGRYDSVSWTDASGNLWLFGGYSYDSAGTNGYLNDLWEYQP